MFGIIKKTVFLAFSTLILSSCWAPRCPMESCHAKYEHQHGDMVSGVFASRYSIFPSKFHFFWDKDKGDANPNTDFVAGPDGKKKVKIKKKYPWERW